MVGLNVNVISEYHKRIVGNIRKQNLVLKSFHLVFQVRNHREIFNKNVLETDFVNWQNVYICLSFQA